MKKIIITIYLSFLGIGLYAQLSEGFIIYKKTIETDRIRTILGTWKQLQSPLTLSGLYKLKFNKNAYKYLPYEKIEEDSILETNTVKSLLYGSIDMHKQFYFEYKKKTGNLVINDRIDVITVVNYAIPRTFEITNETKNILGYKCKKAVCKWSNNRVAEIVAWFTDALPQNMGPEDFRGLPGTILEVSVGTKIVIEAISITPQSLVKIPVPIYGKK